MYDKALQARERHLKNASNWDEFMSALNNRDIVLADWCDCVECEERIKDLSKEESMRPWRHWPLRAKYLGLLQHSGAGLLHSPIL